MSPELSAALVTVLGAIAACLYGVAAYVRGAAKALEERNRQTADLAERLGKVTADVNEAWVRIRAIEKDLGREPAQ